MLKIPYSILFAVILAFMVIGAYGVENSVFDVFIMQLFGVLGYLSRNSTFRWRP
jgi:putative tricarboxylic transport membrane protein